MRSDAGSRYECLCVSGVIWACSNSYASDGLGLLGL